MIGKNLAFYRLKKNLTKKALAELARVSVHEISACEMGKHIPDMDIVKRLAEVLDAKIEDLLAARNERLVFQHAEFRKQSTLPVKKQELVRSITEEYFSRFFDVVEFLGEDVLPTPPATHILHLYSDAEESARSLRSHLHLSTEGPVYNLIGLLENKGVLILLQEGDRAFCGMNGTVNGYPYIVINSKMNSAPIRTTLVHELAHIMFAWPDTMSNKECEKLATAIAGAFLFPADDAKRELGVKRNQVSNDMSRVCEEYGISMYLLTMRARICGIISREAERQFYIKAGNMGWKHNEPERAVKESPSLFEQLVCRAVCENEISLQKGVELLRVPLKQLAERCNFIEGA